MQPENKQNLEAIEQNNNVVNESNKIPIKNIVHIVYLCQALSFFFGISFIVGMIIAYLKRDEVKGTWLESHLAWQTRTFLFGLVGFAIGFVLMFVFIGFLVFAANIIWIIYRVIKGWMLLLDGKEVPNCMNLI